MQTLNASVSVSVTQCSTCRNPLESGARYCGGCGSLTPIQGAPTVAPPSFAQVAPLQAPAISKELQAEASRLLMQLARERLLLLFHWTLFIGMNFAGFLLAIKCYNEFIGDELTKIMVGTTPFLYINSLALLCIVLIRGTRREISRLKERISYVKFKIDFGHLM